MADSFRKLWLCAAVTKEYQQGIVKASADAKFFARGYLVGRRPTLQMNTANATAASRVHASRTSGVGRLGAAAAKAAHAAPAAIAFMLPPSALLAAASSA
ncbi:hypothetical protein [Burkholderia ubonensis]|uniref:hypothetical protein n=1 Tax=Burkholderia ubonensis TaxID=101571 RepID=UPI0012F8AA41|nr:hypothetical protein [Burkholderia ubonensis]